jgi:hypothetical protein
MKGEDALSFPLPRREGMKGRVEERSMKMALIKRRHESPGRE